VEITEIIFPKEMKIKRKKASPVRNPAAH
jgi:hypothetical protein